MQAALNACFAGACLARHASFLPRVLKVMRERARKSPSVTFP
jgi:hypothetical protein